MSISQMPIQLPQPSSSSSSHPIISASVTRILTLSNFSPELKTRDLQSVFARWSEEKGGYKIKWIDDITALAVFADATVAKRAYLALLLDPPAILPPPATIRPYDGPDAQAIIHSVNARSHGHASGNSRASFAGSSSVTGGMGQGGMRGVNSTPFTIPAPSMGHASHGRASSISVVPGGGAGASSGAGIGHTRKGSFSTSGGMNSGMTGHNRGSSISTSVPGSWGRNSVSGVLSGFQGTGFQGLDRATLASSRLPTHMEAESPARPTAQTNQASTATGSGPSGQLPPTFQSSSSDSQSNTSSSHDDLTSPPLDVVGTLPPEGGPGGIRPRVTDGAKRMVNHGIGAKHPVSNGSSNDESAGSNGNANTNTNNMLTDFNKIRRESLDAESAEKALREVQKALSGLGVATTVES